MFKKFSAFMAPQKFITMFTEAAITPYPETVQASPQIPSTSCLAVDPSLCFRTKNFTNISLPLGELHFAPV
jgi:hypothetical protein